MTEKKSLGAFDFSFDTSLDFMGEVTASAQNTQEDMSELFLPNTEGRTEFLPPDAENMPVIENAVKQDSDEYAARPAEERTRELFAQMKPHRLALSAIVAAAGEAPLKTADVEGIVKESQQKFSVYAPSNLCTMLEIAGALQRVTEDGTAYQTVDIEPNIEIIDGDEYYVPAETRTVCWRATDAGLAMLEDENPLEGVADLFEREQDFKPIYKRVLAATAAEEGASMNELSNLVDEDPLISKPRRFYVQHFVESLERCNAVIWRGGAWHITDAGKEAQKLLAGVVDTYEPPQLEEGAAIPTETDGINW